MVKRRWQGAAFLLLLLVTTSACDNTATQTIASASAPFSITITYQRGLTYTGLIVLKQRKTLEKQFPHTFMWQQIASGLAVREAMIVHQVQVGSLGIPLFLVGWDKGFDWRILATLSRLVAKDPRIKSLKDGMPNEKIGVPTPDSLQAVTLRKAVLQELGNAHAFGNNLVSPSSADGVQSPLDRQIVAQAAYYLSQEQADKPAASQFKTWLEQPGGVYKTTPERVLSYATFMHTISMITNNPTFIKDLELPTL